MSEDDRKEEEQEAKEDLELSEEDADQVGGGYLKIKLDSEITKTDKW